MAKHTVRSCLWLEFRILLSRTDYILGVPKNGRFKATVFLIHGWPDLSYGWRYQIPFLIKQNMRVVVPDMMGYGGTVSWPRPAIFRSVPPDHPCFRMLHAHRLLTCAFIPSNKLLTIYRSWLSSCKPLRSSWAATIGVAL